jgi:hypothetical protein
VAIALLLDAASPFAVRVTGVTVAVAGSEEIAVVDPLFDSLAVARGFSVSGATAEAA